MRFCIAAQLHTTGVSKKERQFGTSWPIIVRPNMTWEYNRQLYTLAARHTIIGEPCFASASVLPILRSKLPVRPVSPPASIVNERTNEQQNTRSLARSFVRSFTRSFELRIELGFSAGGDTGAGGACGALGCMHCTKSYFIMMIWPRIHVRRHHLVLHRDGRQWCHTLPEQTGTTTRVDLYYIPAPPAQTICPMDTRGSFICSSQNECILRCPKAR